MQVILVCSLFFIVLFLFFMYHTQIQKIQIFLKMKKYSDLAGYNKYMGILDNLENAWDADFQWESKPMPNKDNMGRNKLELDEEFVMEEIDKDQ